MQDKHLPSKKALERTAFVSLHVAATIAIMFFTPVGWSIFVVTFVLLPLFASPGWVILSALIITWLICLMVVEYIYFFFMRKHLPVLR